MKKILTAMVGILVLAMALAMRTAAQDGAGELRAFTETAAVAGNEGRLAGIIREELKTFAPRTDNLGNVIVTLGSGEPKRLVATAIDEAGYVVSGITEEGYLRVQRLPQAAPHGVFDLLHAAEPAWVMTRSGKKVAGVFAGLSTHLQPGRKNAPKMNHPDELYVDIGAGSEAEARAAGVDVLDAVVINRKLLNVGAGAAYAGAAVGDRFGAAALVEMVRGIDAKELKGTLTVAFLTQQWTGGRGLDRLLNEVQAEEMIFVGRMGPREAGKGEILAEPGTGVLLGVKEAGGAAEGFTAELRALAEKNHIAVTSVAAAGPRIAGYAKSSAMPGRLALAGIATAWAATPAETIGSADFAALQELLRAYAGAGEERKTGETAEKKKIPRAPGTVLSQLSESYGASGHEGAVREKVKELLPKWAKTETDVAGNLVLHMGDGKGGAKTKRIVFVAHMDEIGYQVREIAADGTLLVDFLGGGFSEYFLGHVALVHTAKGDVGGVMEPPAGWEQAGFEWPHAARGTEEPARVYVGTKSAEETKGLGIAAGDWITIPKEYRALLGTRANARSFDDRVGCAALVEAVRALGPELPGRDVTFIWSTEEEVGLKGAAAAAERMAAAGQAPDFVFAIDTFVSADSPLELKRFGDAKVGKGFVVRAVDNSNIVPREYVERVVKMARANGIAVQYGVTGGGNDGAVFPRYGAVDVALGWPLRYSHSAAEVIDTRDEEALGKMIGVLAKSW